MLRRVAEDIDLGDFYFLAVFHPVETNKDVVLRDVGDGDPLVTDSGVDDPSVTKVVERKCDGFPSALDADDLLLRRKPGVVERDRVEHPVFAGVGLVERHQNVEQPLEGLLIRVVENLAVGEERFVGLPRHLRDG